MEFTNFLTAQVFTSSSAILLYVVNFFSPLLTVVGNRDKTSFGKSFVTTHGILYSTAFTSLALVGFVLSRFLILIFELMALFALCVYYDFSKSWGLFTISAIDLGIWSFLAKIKFMKEETILVRMICTYFLEIFLIIGISWIVGYLVETLAAIF